MSKSDLMRTHDFLGNEFVTATCKRCGTKYRRMSIDRMMPVCPPCEPEDTKEYQAKLKQKRRK